MRGKLRLGGLEILGHDVRHVGAADLELVGCLLVIGPSLFASTLLVGQPLVVSLQLLQLLVLLHGHLVLEHASHASHVISLGGVFGLLVLEAVVDCLLLSRLLCDPLLLDTCVLVQTVSVVYRREDHGSKNALVLVKQIKWDGVKQK